MPLATIVPVMLDCPPGDLCRRRYSGHTHGCPNYGKRATCPPAAEIWTPEYLESRRWTAVWNTFDFGAHVAKMRVAHPAWSERQLANCLYWQGGARRNLRVEVRRFMMNIAPPQPPVEYVPEAHGVNVTATMASLGIALEWPPKTVAYQVALVGLPKE